MNIVKRIFFAAVENKSSAYFLPVRDITRQLKHVIISLCVRYTIRFGGGCNVFVSGALCGCIPHPNLFRAIVQGNF